MDFVDLSSLPKGSSASIHIDEDGNLVSLNYVESSHVKEYEDDKMYFYSKMHPNASTSEAEMFKKVIETIDRKRFYSEKREKEKYEDAKGRYNWFSYQMWKADQFVYDHGDVIGQVIIALIPPASALNSGYTILNGEDIMGNEKSGFLERYALPTVDIALFGRGLKYNVLLPGLTPVNEMTKLGTKINIAADVWYGVNVFRPITGL